MEDISANQASPTTAAYVWRTVSIVIPVRNGAASLRQCLAALRDSTYPEFELIVVDDASTDDSAAVARAFGARLVRLEEQSGPAVARNRGVAAGRGEFVCFLDADVCVARDSLNQIVRAFESDPAVDAVFGSYDDQPAATNFLSQYKNLFHHFVHQQASANACTFWTGCGAIRRSVFLEAGGFDERYERPCIEDIELGARLTRRGHRILLCRDVQVTHLKHWTWWGMVRSDVLDRGIPWTELILRDGRLPNDLNLRFSQRISALLACLLSLAVMAGLFLAALILLVTVVAINDRFYRFFVTKRGWLFAARAIPLHVAYYLYSAAAFGIGWTRHASRSSAVVFSKLLKPGRTARHARTALQTGRTVL